MVIEQNIKLGKYFDANWYLDTYPDVAEAGVEPLEHYINCGRGEGRFPCKIEAFELEKELWTTDNTDEIEKKLITLFSNSSDFSRCLAGWVLGRWYGSYGKWDLVEQYLPEALKDPMALYLIAHQGPYLLLFDAYYWQGKLSAAQALLNNNTWPTSNNKLLAQNMLLDNESRADDLTELFANNQLLGVSVKHPEKPLGLDNLIGLNVPRNKTLKDILQPLVSIIIPCFNAQDTIKTAVTSLLNQTWKNLEIIIIDDASCDDSWQVLQSLSTQDQRIKLLRHDVNLGAYRARNYGLSMARGKYITVHDIDDWSHPQKVECQVNGLRQKRNAIASVSHWVRADEELRFQRWRMEDGWIYRNVSSLMLKRSVFRRLGYWDNVSVNADTEYYHRILASYGVNSIVEVFPGIPLSFGRATNESLSQSKASHLRTQFKGLRKDYHDAAITWHKTHKKLYLTRLPNQRPFAVPPTMLRGNDAQRKHNLTLLLQSSELFDRTWYLTRYPDIAKAGVEPVAHFINNGIHEARDCNPVISISGQAYLHKTNKLAVIEHLLNESHLPECTELDGEILFHDDKPTILCVGHMVSEHTFGAERSFLDTLKMFSQSDFNIVVVLPNAENLDYVEKVSALCSKVIFQPMQWWNANRDTDEKVVDAFSQIIEQLNIALVYANTLVLSEPLNAATRNNRKTVMHIRELPLNDPDLCEALGADAETVRNHCLKSSDYFIANSLAVLNFIDFKSRAFLIPNVIDIDVTTSKLPSVKLPVIASLLSSNLPKKGIEDLLKVAELCEAKQFPIEFHIYGPENEHTANWKKQTSLQNLKWKGYCQSSFEALKDTDILLNLSHFQESFGRTVIEGMASGCAVVAYEWGAIPELVDEKNGILVPFKDIEGVVNALGLLIKEPSLIVKLGVNGRSKAVEGYSYQKVKPSMLSAIQQILK
ncbi:glycosyltransferase [Aliiglaciecola sp. SL4]|uniref:glycosyltransferase n=1 Tax=Aliiglaciecola sp. SL4 TaxID=3239806 RepID=UPI00355B06E5